MPTEMLINVAESEECRVAVVEKGSLEELYVEREWLSGHVGNIYKGKVVNIERGIQAAFIDFGVGRNGFLHVSDLHPRYFPKKSGNASEHIGRRKSVKERPPIQNSLKKGQEVIVQVIKEGLRTKGPTLSTYLSIAGKYLVMMPWMDGLGVSHKIVDVEDRKKLREMLDQCRTPESHGFIIRTAGVGCTKREVQSDLNYIKRLWSAIERRIKTESTPVELYRESDLVIRTLRDIFNSKIDKIICDSESVTRRIKDFLSIAMPRFKKRVSYYKGTVPLFHKYGIESEIGKVQSRRVELRSGGSIVIEPTEALVAIDVNSGRSRTQSSPEQTAYKTNMAAAVEIARQLRLRDLGGLIICDFIDMHKSDNRHSVEKVFRDALKTDRAKYRVLKISRFGVIELTRQRMRPSMQSGANLECPHCGGTGYVKSHESLSTEIIRLLNLYLARDEIKQIELFVAPQVAGFLQNEKRTTIARMEEVTGKRVAINADPTYISERRNFICYDDQKNIISI